MTRWEKFVKGTLAVLVVFAGVGLVGVVGAIVFQNADAASKDRYHALGSEILIPMLTAVIALFAATAAVKAFSTVWYNVHRKDGDNYEPIKLFDW